VGQAQLAARIRDHIRKLGGDAEIADELLAASRKANLPLADACALIEVESTFRNVYGHDQVRNPIKSPPNGVLRVTAANYREYKRHRRNGEGSQGVGYGQLTAKEFQDRADKAGGCHKAGPNLVTSFRILREHQQSFGRDEGIAAYNTGPGARKSKQGRAYSAKVRGAAAAWAKRLGGNGDAPIPFASRKIGPGDSGSDVKEFQRHLNKRLAARSLPTIGVDGDYGQTTERARHDVTKLLGFPASVVHRTGATPRVQTLVKEPSRRPKSYLETAKKRRRKAERE
jgi:hypothetical protein